MANFDLYTSDGEGPVRVYTMYQDADGEWQVSVDYVDLDFHDPFDLEPVAPSIQDERLEEIQKFYTNVIGTRIKKSAGFRYYLKLEWPTVKLTERGTLTGLANIGIGQRVRVYPHNDSTLIHFDCIVEENNVTAKEHVDSIRYPTYAPSIAFRGVHIVRFIPHNFSAYHYFFVDKTAWGAYTVAEQQRAVTMRDKTPAVWITYVSSDYEGYFTRKNLEQVPGA